MSDEIFLQNDERFFGYAHRAFTAPDGRLRSIWRFFLSIVVALFAKLGAEIVASIFGAGRFAFFVYCVLLVILVVAGFCLLLKVVDEAEGNPLAAMGLAFRKPWLRDAIKGLGLGFLMIFIAYLVIRFTCELTVNIHLNHRAEKLFVLELCTLAAGAMLEEAIFRGYPFQRLVESFGGAVGWFGKHASFTLAADRSRVIGAWIAAILWSSAFGAAHFSNPDATIWSFLNTSFVGILFCLAYLRTGSLWMPWGMHFAWNTTLGVVLGLPVSGLTQFGVVVNSKAVGPLWITGGPYGIEGSALGTVVIVLGFLIVLIFVKPRAIVGSSEVSPAREISAPIEIRTESIQ